MKKLVTVLSIVLILIAHQAVFANTSSIECSASTDGQLVHISGKIANAEKSSPITLRVGSVENILYVWQTMSSDDGSFSFDFEMPDTTPSGTYEYLVASDAGVSSYSGEIEYVAESRIVCSAKVVNRRVNISGKIVNAEKSSSVTLRVGDVQNILYVWQTMSGDDGSFSFDFEMPDTTSSGDYEYLVATNTGLSAYSGILTYTTDPRIVCTATVTGQTINISGTIVNSTSSNNVSLTFGDSDNPIYAAETACGEDGKFSFSIEMPSTVTDGEYNYIISTDFENLSCEGYILYTRPTYQIGCEASVVDAVVDVHVYLVGEPEIPAFFELEIRKDGEIVHRDTSASGVYGNGTNILFMMSENILSGEYEMIITETLNNTESYYGTLHYVSPYAEIDENFVNAVIDVNIKNYVPTITCAMSCDRGKWLSVVINDEANNKSVGSITAHYTTGRETVTYTLPRISNGQRYSLMVHCEDEEDNLITIESILDFGFLTIVVDGDIQLADEVWLNAKVQSERFDLLNRSATYTQSKTSSIILPNLLANMDCTITLNGYQKKTVYVEETPEYDPEIKTKQIDDNSVIYDVPSSQDNKKQSYEFIASNSGLYYISAGECTVYVFNQNGVLLTETALNSRCFVLTAGEKYTVQSRLYSPQNAFALVVKNIETNAITNQNITYQKSITLSSNENGLMTLDNLKANWYHAGDKAEYYSANGSLYVRENGVEKKLVDNVEAKFITTDNYYIYFCDMLKDGSIYRYDKNGGDLMIFSTDRASWLYIQSGYLYYTDNTNGRTQKRIQIY